MAEAVLSPPAGEALQVLITTTALVVGQNRFAFGLLKEHQLLEDAHAVVNWRIIRQPFPRHYLTLSA
jgi:hypothetical protein